MVEIIISIAAIILLTVLIVKKYNTTIALLFCGIILLAAAVILGHPVLDTEASTGLALLDIFKNIETAFLSQLGNIGLTLMTLMGYSTYMTYIGANDKTVQVMLKPLGMIKSKYILVPIIFILGNLLSLVVPSASSLGVLLMATLFPILTRVGMSPLTAAGIIATTATIMPTPLGADNVIAAETFGMNIIDYVGKHAMISIPSLLLMAIAHYFWQKRCDKRDEAKGVAFKTELKGLREDLPSTVYALLPVLPLILVIVINLGFPSLKVGLVTITFISLFVSIIFEAFRKKNIAKVTQDVQEFFKGMGTGLASVVSIMVAATVFVNGLKALGIIDMLMDSANGLKGAGIIMMLAFSGITFIIGLISGNGLSVFYATVGIIPSVAAAAGVSPAMIALPMQMIANLVRSISPVAAVIVIVASSTGATPVQLVKRTSVPIIVGTISCLVLSFVLLF
ncbi:MAG TPA: C4-dicarboxylate ABC transporter [Lachnoclostridium phytofermentans]|uniref:C4-dicarboxylate ABC transporter n=1 Tax=Lachnoclostridium phytofermentans TaxID=66219 RepID=A0A3D2X6M8_9FIRM|nr:C4-dicarboxylate transporter DcuC [Lachnoclostridium sp.]HCL02544.1 C4-dicarboxylate ABC transporter [Lachnoclostridium phytofermentans]